ncbi:MAG: 23S rRNA (pseudouridine(1915)-N(3))-methyltransferase RlmH [Acidobacteriota bacterium]|nr:23S rRNA (pseudouridine(1915)-N(3))-methyltransferase RlmH [Acidobacteriota bacterium]
MKITLAAVVPRSSRAKGQAVEAMIDDFLTRASRTIPAATQLFETEAALLESLATAPGRTRATAMLLDSRGQMMTSEEFAARLGRLRDEGTQRLVLAIGPADGWSAAARAQATQMLSLGRITLPHQLARLVLAEQIYRATAILSGHPYHAGH